MRFEGKKVIVTGAGRGIGRACALSLAREGADVVIVDLDEATASTTAADVRALGREAIVLGVDLSDPEAPREVVEHTLSAWGRIDILVNNAGITIVKSVLEFEESEWRRMFDINLHSLIKLSQLCAKSMVDHHSGKIVNVASEAGKTVHSPYFTLYAATKAGVIAFTRGIARELAPYGINVNAVCPGVIDTKMWESNDASLSKQMGLKKGQAMETRRRSIPLGRLGTPEDVARVVAFLASNESEYMTGQALNVTGGREQH